MIKFLTTSIFFALSISSAAPDLVPFFRVTQIHSSSVFDSILVESAVINNGSTASYSQTIDLAVISIGKDSLTPLKYHNIPANYVINSGSFMSFKDTLQVIPIVFSINVYVDPLGYLDGFKGNNVTSQAYNFHPQQVHDTITVVLYDTVNTTTTLHDTLKTVTHDTTKLTITDTLITHIRDTIKITLRDTIKIHDTTKVVVHDTVKTPTKIKGLGKFAAQDVYTTIYNSMGSIVWTGYLPTGGYPKVKLLQGLHLAVQGQKRYAFRVVYK